MESSILNTPPELIAFAGFDSWNDYENEIYAVYLETVVNANLLFLNTPVKVRFRPTTKDKAFGFWHLISEAVDQNNKNEEDRLPDLKRCERIWWVAWCITNAHQAGFLYWENQRGRETHVVIWAEHLDFVVILAKRKTDLDEKYYLLKTAYCLREHTKRKLRKEYESFHTPKKG